MQDEGRISYHIINPPWFFHPPSISFCCLQVNEIDTDGSDRIEFKEFCIFIIFKFFDVDNDGYVNLSDIKITVDNLGLCETHAVG